jgi:hypothetical protein
MGRIDSAVTASSTFANADRIKGPQADAIFERTDHPQVSNYLCCVVVLSLEWPVDGFWVDVLLLFCPSGFSVVVVLELVWAKPAPPRARLSPMANAAIVVFERMVFLLF